MLKGDICWALHRAHSLRKAPDAGNQDMVGDISMVAPVFKVSLNGNWTDPKQK